MTQTASARTALNQERVVAALVTTFSPDPLMRWFYADPADYLAHFPGFVRIFGGRSFEMGTADTLEDLRGAALWLPPGVLWDDEALTAHMMETLDEERGQAAAEFDREVSRYLPEEPHWYLAVLGVDPPSQSRGRGSELIAPRLRQCDEAGQVAHLVSSNPRNHSFYQRHGFEIMDEIRVADGPPTWPMIRMPR